MQSRRVRRGGFQGGPIFLGGSSGARPMVEVVMYRC